MQSFLVPPEEAIVDVLVVGGGINGASTAQHLAAAGYTVLLVEKGDFASAATSRSTRILHFGLRYLAPEKTPWEYLRHPASLLSKFRESLVLAREYDRFRRESPSYLNSYPVFVPVYKDSGIAGWQIDIAAYFLGAMRKSSQAKYRRHAGAAARALLPASLLRGRDDIEQMIEFEDCQFAWPERICLDALMDTERMGGRVLNYTKVTALSYEGGLWNANIEDIDGKVAQRVRAKFVVNTAGVWVDKVIAMAGKSMAQKPKQKAVAVKGVHILVKLPPQYDGQIIVGRNRSNTQLSCIPWRGHHYIGPTEIPYQGDIEDVVPLEEDVAFLVKETNYFFPHLNLTRDDVLFAWAGVRPKTYHPEHATGDPAGVGKIFDLSEEGLPNFLTLTWGTLNQHRLSARRLVELVQKRIQPTGGAQELSYAASINQSALRVGSDRLRGAPLDLDTIVRIARTERPRTLVDLLFRRVDLGWGPSVSYEDVRQIGGAVAPVLGWSETRLATEIEDYIAYVRRRHLCDIRDASVQAPAASSSATFTFDGRPVPFREGETVGTALLQAGIVQLRVAETGDPRGILCGIGVCWECRCVIDERVNSRACMTPAKAGMAVRRQMGLS